MEEYVREEQIKGYICTWSDVDGNHCVSAETMDAAYSQYVMLAHCADDFTCIKQVSIVFE